MSKPISAKIHALLKNIVADGIENYAIAVQDPNKKGDGFIGDLTFITLEHLKGGRKLNVVIKRAFEDEIARSVHPIRTYFLTEIYFYEKLWPCFEKFQRQKFASKIFDKVPKCYLTTTEEKGETIILENVKYLGYQLIDKRIPLDNEHLEFIFREYGKFHAVSFAYKELNPTEYSEILKGVQNNFLLVSQAKSFRDYIKFIFELCLKSLHPTRDSKVIEVYKTYVENGADIFGNASVYNGKYSVVLHGDCWTNNILFNYDEFGKPSDLRLIDFQFIYEGTPVSDLSYLLYTSGSKEQFHRLDHYLRIYHDSLRDTLKGAGCNSDVYPFHELKKEWKQHCRVGFTAGLLIWRSKLIEESDAKNITEVGEGDMFRDSKFDESTFRKITRDIILHMYESDCL